MNEPDSGAPTPWKPPEATRDSSDPGEAPARDFHARAPSLRAATATFALLFFLGGQIGATTVITVFEMIRHAIFGDLEIGNPEAVESFTREIMPQLVLSGMLGGACGLALGALLVRDRLQDPSREGAAWTRGTLQGWLMGLGVGLVAAAIYIAFPLFLIPPDPDAEGGPLSQMLAEPGFHRAVWVILALILAPPLEELLFRGLMLGGYIRSLGLVRAAVLTNVIFLLLHFTEAMYYLPSFLGLALLAAGATWQRLRWSSVGPAVATHVGYNGLITIYAFTVEIP